MLRIDSTALPCEALAEDDGPRTPRNPRRADRQSTRCGRAARAQRRIVEAGVADYRRRSQR